MKKRRRWWLIILAVVIVAAAGATAGVLWFGRSKTAAVHYLTATAATGTIADTVQANFTLSDARAAMTLTLGGASSSTGSGGSGSTTGSNSSTTGNATSSIGTVGAVTTYSAMTTRKASTAAPTLWSSSSPSPTPTTTPTSTPTPTPTPTPTRSGTPLPSPTPSRSGGGGFGSSTGLGAGGSTSSSSSTTSTGVSGVVTRIALPAGATPRTLQRLLAVSGKPIFAFVSSTPLYKTLSVNLSSGSQVANVAALQRALKSRGYYTGSINGTFGSTTQTALEAWQADNGLSQTGEITTSQFVWVPRGSILSSWNVSLGSQVSGTTALATVVAPRELMAQALVSQADIASLKVGQKARLTIDGYTSDAFTGTISYIDTQPASSGSSSTVDYTVNVVPHGLPSVARSGMTGALEVVIAQRKNVLLVPTSAVSGTSSVPYLRVMMNGKPAYRQVQTGMSIAASTQITGGLTAGEVVIIGQYTNSASSTGGGSGGFGFPGLGGGGFRRSGGSGGSGQGGFPVPPGQ